MMDGEAPGARVGGSALGSCPTQSKAKQRERERERQRERDPKALPKWGALWAGGPDKPL